MKKLNKETKRLFRNRNKVKKFSKEYLSCLANKAKDKSNFVLDTSNIKEKKTISEWFKKKDEF